MWIISCFTHYFFFPQGEKSWFGGAGSWGTLTDTVVLVVVYWGKIESGFQSSSKKTLLFFPALRKLNGSKQKEIGTTQTIPHHFFLPGGKAHCFLCEACSKPNWTLHNSIASKSTDRRISYSSQMSIERFGGLKTAKCSVGLVAVLHWERGMSCTLDFDPIIRARRNQYHRPILTFVVESSPWTHAEIKKYFHIWLT